jgi:hypothetical protein
MIPVVILADIRLYREGLADMFRLVVDDCPKPHLVSLARSEPVTAAPDPPSEA